MNALVRINGHAVPRLQYRDQSVLTLPMIDEIHGRTSGSSKKQFWRNKEMFIAGTDYFEVPHAEWGPLLNAYKKEIQAGTKTNLVGSKRHHQDEEINLEFPFPDPPPSTPALTAELPAVAAKTTRNKLRQPSLPLPETKQNHGGHRGTMFFLTQSGYALLVKVFNDPLAWAIQLELVRSYFHQKQSRARRLVL